MENKTNKEDASTFSRDELIRSCDNDLSLLEKNLYEIEDTKGLIKNILKEVGKNDIIVKAQTCCEISSGVTMGLHDSIMGLKMMICTTRTYEKCYHMKFINLLQYEMCYYLIGKRNKGGQLYNLLKCIKKDDTVTKESILEIIDKVKCLLSYCNPELRRITAHYDQPLKMYRVLSTLKDEEIYSKRVEYQSEISDKLSKLLLKIIQITIKPSLNNFPEQNHTDINSNLIDSINDFTSLGFDSKTEFKDLVHEMLDTAWPDLSELAKSLIHAQIQDELSKELKLKSRKYSDIYIIQNLGMETFLLRTDLLCAMNNYLEAKTNIEKASALYLAYITETAALTNLYGYNSKAKERSIWQQLITIPEYTCNKLASKIELELKEITSDLNPDLRNRHTHYSENGHSNITKRWEDLLKYPHAFSIIRLRKLIDLTSDIFYCISEIVKEKTRKVIENRQRQ